MRSFYAEFQRIAWARALVMILLGGWIIAQPGRVFGLIVNILALVLFVFGISNLISGFRARRSGAGNVGLGIGVGLLIAALLVEGLAGMVVSMFPVIAGIALIIYGASMLMGARQQQFVNVTRTWPTIYGVLVLLAGIFLVIHPFGTAMFVFRVLGAIFLMMGVSELVSWIKYK